MDIIKLIIVKQWGNTHHAKIKTVDESDEFEGWSSRNGFFCAILWRSRVSYREIAGKLHQFISPLRRS